MKTHYVVCVDGATDTSKLYLIQADNTQWKLVQKMNSFMKLLDRLIDHEFPQQLHEELVIAYTDFKMTGRASTRHGTYVTWYLAMFDELTMHFEVDSNP